MTFAEFCSVDFQLTVIGPKGLKALLNTVFNLTASGIPYPLNIAELGGDFPHLVEIERERAEWAAKAAAKADVKDSKAEAAAPHKADEKAGDKPKAEAPKFALEKEGIRLPCCRNFLSRQMLTIFSLLCSGFPAY
jgi:hypothetical protein